MTRVQLDPRQTLAVARLIASRAMPYFSTVLYNLIPVPKPGLGTFAVTKRGVLLWDPQKAEEWGVDQCAAVLLHEIGHLLKGHADRAAALGVSNENARAWNVCGDAEINDDLIVAFKHHNAHSNKNKLELPEGAIVPSMLPCADGTVGQPDGRLAEEYYRNLPKQNSGGGGGDQGEEGDAQEGEGEGGSGKNSSQKDDGGHAKNAPGAGHCGSCAGNPNAEEPQDADGQVDGKGRSDAELARIRRQVAGDIQRQREGKSVGSVPEGWAVWADAQLQPAKVRWQDRVDRIARHAIAHKAGQRDFKYDRPSRRQGALGYGRGIAVLPRMFAPVPHVAFVIDTSGSMGTAEGQIVLAEVDGVLRATGAQVSLLTCDAEVHGAAKVRTMREVMNNLKGGGGTLFNPAFEALLKLRPRPNVVIFGTDGDNFDQLPHAQPAGMIVIWLLVGNYARPPRFEGAPWGEMIYVTEDEVKEQNESLRLRA